MPATPFRPPSPILQRPGSNLRLAIPSATQCRPWTNQGAQAISMSDSGRDQAVGCVHRPASPRLVARPASPLVSAPPSSPRVSARLASPRVATRPAPLESDRHATPTQPPLEEPLQQQLHQPLQAPLPLQHPFDLPLHSQTVVPPGVLVDNFPQNPVLEPEGVSPEDDVAAVKATGAMGRVSLGGGASTDDTCTSSIGESANVRSAVSHVHSPRRSRTRVATSPTRQRSASQLECFRVLGVARTASLQEIRVAYRSLCRKWHPDVNKDAGAAAMFMDVNRAYEAAVHAHERASKPKPQRPARRKDDFDEFWDDFLGGKPSTPKADPRRKRQGMKPGTNGGGERMRDPLAW